MYENLIQKPLKAACEVTLSPFCLSTVTVCLQAAGRQGGMAVPLNCISCRESRNWCRLPKRSKQILVGTAVLAGTLSKLTPTLIKCSWTVSLDKSVGYLKSKLFCVVCLAVACRQLLDTVYFDPPGLLSSRPVDR
jgi:hypothetical protein